LRAAGPSAVRGGLRKEGIVPTIKPARAQVGPLFCGEHRTQPASHVLTSNGVAIALCGTCMTELAEQLATLRLQYISPARNSWSALAAGAR
jgi:hypothetical protein